ncbi:hypothetical protein DL766_003023 [Monosporascus sp. MC13-8B]|uniref:Major facilitator superfamily (MFS) profile domain-containing protein n=1 Tax=Monosporascus cannonballus TaxID=155416 RepID=A0ABY0HBE8_9PEZI|nr:hypothetical protein DL762_004724 [Monosporascus cannonballus]RYO98775.1 hypothetical protein DL763_002036 [Monosporascus cannonballus]RYP34374.1 hypothetical protein DL766_003023 [Monosporascus sp. MC13-8B]
MATPRTAPPKGNRLRIDCIGPFCKTVATPTGQLWLRPWYRSQVRYDPDLCGRVLAAEAPRCSGHAMADVDCAFGIMLGYVADLEFYHVRDKRVIGLNWMLMMGSAMIPVVVVCAIVFFVPESPRWYLTKNRRLDAYKAISRLRYEKVQTVRDLFYKDMLLQVERDAMDIGRSKPKEIFKFSLDSEDSSAESQVSNDVNGYFLEDWPLTNEKDPLRVLAADASVLGRWSPWGHVLEDGRAYNEKLMAMSRGDVRPDRNMPVEYMTRDLWEHMRGHHRESADELLEPTFEFMRAQTHPTLLKWMELK